MPESGRAVERRRRIHDLLDAGAGACVLADPACAHIVQESLLFGDGERYRLLAWVVMPNHVHALIEQADWSLARIVQSWKRHTARTIRMGTGDDAPGLWAREYWDRFIRDERHFLTTRAYIEQNPVKAGLVQDATAWPWGHLGWRRLRPED